LFICGFDRNVSQLSVSHLYASAFNMLQRTYKSRYRQTTTIFKFPDDGRLISFESHLHKWFGCRVTAVSKVYSKNVCSKGMVLRKKVPAATGIRTNDVSFPSQVLYHLNTVLWFSKECCSIFSAPLRSTHFAERMEARVNLR